MRTSRHMRRLEIRLIHDDGQVALIQSPQRVKKIGVRMKFGWAVALIGFYIMYGYNKEWTTTINPRQDGGPP